MATKINFNEIKNMPNLISIPRVESRAPQKNTIEWKIPGKVSVVYMLIARMGYTAIIKIKKEKKHWWNKSWKNFVINNPDPAHTITKAVDILNENGYTIDHNTMKFGERIGDPEYFENLDL